MRRAECAGDTTSLVLASEDQMPFRYQATAYALSAHLEQPISQVVDKQALVELPADGSYSFQTAAAFRLEGVLSYSSAQTQVAGHKGSDGYNTLATSIIENLNLLDVVTADRVVAQISTEQSDGTPSVTFLGTRFENLRIAGYPLELKQDLNVLGSMPAKDRSYLEDPNLQSRIAEQYAKLRHSIDVPERLRERLNLDQQPYTAEGAKFSLVQRISGDFPGRSFGHAIHVPHFGTIFFSEVALAPHLFSLTMLRVEMNSLAKGDSTFAHVGISSRGTAGGGPGTQESGDGPPR